MNCLKWFEIVTTTEKFCSVWGIHPRWKAISIFHESKKSLTKKFFSTWLTLNAGIDMVRFSKEKEEITFWWQIKSFFFLFLHPPSSSSSSSTSVFAPRTHRIRCLSISFSIFEGWLWTEPMFFQCLQSDTCCSPPGPGLRTRRGEASRSEGNDEGESWKAIDSL